MRGPTSVSGPGRTTTPPNGLPHRHGCGPGGVCRPFSGNHQEAPNGPTGSAHAHWLDRHVFGRGETVAGEAPPAQTKSDGPPQKEQPCEVKKRISLRTKACEDLANAIGTFTNPLHLTMLRLELVKILGCFERMTPDGSTLRRSTWSTEVVRSSECVQKARDWNARRGDS